LTSEAITADPVAANNGTLGYTLDAVGNRLSRSSTFAALPAQSFTYDANDGLNGDTFDANGNTIASGGTTYQYDFEDRVIRAGTVTMVYDGDGNRVSKTVGTSVTRYLVDELSPTGYPEVAEEVVNGTVQRTYTHGLKWVSQSWPGASIVVNYYGYDAHGNVRSLFNSSGAMTDAYEYDAFGLIVASSGTTPNSYLYTGEQLDSDVGLYYLRARWYKPQTGWFFTADAWEGMQDEPASLHRYSWPCAINLAKRANDLTAQRYGNTSLKVVCSELL
jgi:RHS repeat-associated protein